MESALEERLERLEEVRPFAVVYIVAYAAQFAFNAAAVRTQEALWFCALAFGVPLGVLAMWLALATKHPYLIPTVAGMSLMLVGSVVFLSNAFNAIAPSPYNIFASGASFFMDAVGAVVFAG